MERPRSIGKEFSPLNSFESALAEANEGRLSGQNFLGRFLDETVYVPSFAEMKPNGEGLKPIFITKAGVSMMVIFSHLSRVDKESPSKASYCWAITPRKFLKGFPPGFGIVLNPGYSAGLEISPAGVDSLRRA